VRFLFVAGDRIPHRRQEKGRREEAVTDPLFPVSFSRRRVGSREVEKTRRHCFSIPEASLMSPALFPSLEGYSCKLTV